MKRMLNGKQINEKYIHTFFMLLTKRMQRWQNKIKYQLYIPQKQINELKWERNYTAIRE